MSHLGYTKCTCKKKEGVSALTPGENEACRGQRRQEGGKPRKRSGATVDHLMALGPTGAGGRSWGGARVGVLGQERLRGIW